MEQTDTATTPSTENPRPRMSAASWISVALAIIIVLMIAWPYVGNSSFLAERHKADPFILEGWAQPNFDGTAIGFSQQRGGDGEGYVISGAPWKGFDGSWRQAGTLPTCVGNDTGSETRVRLGVVRVRPGSGPGFDAVVWLECLSD